MADEQIERLLQNRHTARLKWVTPWPGVTADGNRVYCHITQSATVHDIINYARKPGHPEMTDADILADFIAVHWAKEEKAGSNWIHRVAAKRDVRP